MSLTRTHIAFLGIISIFTGIIGPGTHSGDILLSYLMTNIRPIIYAILIGLIFAFASAAFRKWKLYRSIVFLIMLGLIIIAIFTAFGYVSGSRDGAPTNGFSWGWIFLSVGALLLFWSYKQRSDDESDGKFSETIDTIIGIMGGFALACIAGVIILSSLSYFTRGRDDSEILTRHFGTGNVRTISGEIQSYGTFPSMPHISYHRGDDYLLMSYENDKENIWEYRSKNTILSGVLRKDEFPYLIDNEVYTIDRDGHVRTASGRVLLGSKSTENRDAIFVKESGMLEYRTDQGRKELSYTGIMSAPIHISKDKTAIVWTENRNNLEYIIKNGNRIGSGARAISEVSLSPNGQNISYLSIGNEGMSIMRNDVSVGKLPGNTVSGSYVSNGSHSLYVTKEKESMEVHFDTSRISRGLEEVREVFLEINGGGSYAYFGRPIGEEKWCLFTRYKGNICGLEGYMNPRLGADGTSIIFAGRKEGVWNIFRNTDSIAQDLGYSPSSVKYDYAFYDLTNPRTFLFIEYDSETKKYSYRKNGKQIPGVWDDVSTEVIFGYDNHILTSAKNGESWEIIEL